MAIAVKFKINTDTIVPFQNILSFEHGLHDGLTYPKHVILNAHDEFVRMIGRDRCHCVGGEARRSVNELWSDEIDLDWVSHVVESLSVTEEGLDATIRILDTPRGEVLRNWIENNDFRPYVRRETRRVKNLVSYLRIVTIDILPANWRV
jgi:hypothetical protein